MVTHRCEKFWFYSHDIINRPYVRPPYANVTSIMLVFIVFIMLLNFSGFSVQF